MAEADWKYLQYNIETGQKRTGDGPSGGASSLSDLDDTSISSPSDGQILGYDETAGKWKNVSAPAESVTDVALDGNTVVNGQGVAVLTTPNVNDLKDTSISNLSNGQTLQYNATNHKWENVTPASGGNVDDVKVNGTSVVTNNVANITSYKEVTQAQYEALPDTKLNDGILYAIKDGGQAVDGFPPLIYSDEEREIGVWRDGKPLYQKTINADFVNGRRDYQHGIQNVDMIFFDDSATFIYAKDKSEFNHFYNAGYNDSAQFVEGYGRFIQQVTQTIIILKANPNIGSNYSAIITLRYTKTTDTPGSGTWTTQGTLAHHYSTDEHIVGTWIDGKPLYEKTFVLQSSQTIAKNTWVTVNIDLTNVKAIIDKRFINSSDGANTGGGSIVLKSNNQLLVGNEQGYNTMTFDTIILQYTKTTD